MGVEESGAKASGATFYTSLEPCCHTGRTPPCVDRIVQSGIARVVASMRDPNPRVNGGGFRALRRMGVAVEVGLLRDEALRLNEPFVKHARTGLPLVTLKGASSLDGRIATRTFDSKWITSASARRHARLLRFEHEAILVGTGTALSDDPRLDRRPRSRSDSPFLRVVLDRVLRFSPRSRLARSRFLGPLLVFCGPGASPKRRRALEALGVEVEEISERGRKFRRLDLEELLRTLGRRGITSLLVEGGGELEGSFLDRRLGDRLVLYVAADHAGRLLDEQLGDAGQAEPVPEHLEVRRGVAHDHVVDGAGHHDGVVGVELHLERRPVRLGAGLPPGPELALDEPRYSAAAC